MQNINIDGNLLIYYGNTAGYIESGKAIVDTMFESADLSEWLFEHWNLRCQFHDGVYKRLMSGQAPKEANPNQKPAAMKFRCRIWQLKPESDFMIRFRDYHELPSPPNQANYEVAAKLDVETDSLEEICSLLEESGHLLRISDVIEIYTGNDSNFYYIGKTKYIPVEFEPQKEEKMEEN